jgi:hypothetical protein
MALASGVLVLASCTSAAKHESSQAEIARCREVASGGCASDDAVNRAREQWKREDERRDEEQRRDEFLHRQNTLR